MTGKLLRGLVAMLIYACVATVIAEALMAAYVVRTWGLSRQRLVQMLAVAYGIDLLAIHDEIEGDLEEDSPEQASYEQILETRAIEVRHLELREQALRDGLDQLRFQQQQLAEEKKRYEQLKQSFDEQLAAIQDQNRSNGMDDNRAKLEAIKPDQAKEILVLMIQNDEIDDVVTLLRGMPTLKAAKIIGEFETAEELEQIAEVLRLIREGNPTSELADTVREKLGTQEAGEP